MYHICTPLIDTSIHPHTQKSPYASTPQHQPQLRKGTMVKQGSALYHQGRRGSLGATSKQDPMKNQFSRSVKRPTAIRSQVGKTHSRQGAATRTQEPNHDDQLMITSARIVSFIWAEECN